MSGKLGTKDVKTGGGGTPKTLQAGNVMATITGVSLDQPPYMVKENGYFLLLHLEGPDLGDGFEGFLVDKDNPDKGRYKGQVGRVKTNRWPYKDGTTKSGIKVDRDADVLKAMKSLCEGMDIVKWFDDQDDKHDTIEELITAFDTDKPFKDKLMNFCICAREYQKQNTYIGLDLFLPKFSKDGIPYEEVTVSPSRLLQFNPLDEKHLEKVAPATAENFEGEPETTGDGKVDGEGKAEFTL